MSYIRMCSQSEQALSQLILQIERDKDQDRGPVFIGIGGPGGGGKSVLSGWLKQRLQNGAVLSLDDFRLPRNLRPRHAPFGSHPDAVDFPRLRKALQTARDGSPVLQPLFNRETGRADQEEPLPKADVYLLDGEITAYRMLDPYLDLRILVQCSLWTQWTTRLRRDRKNRDCSLIKTLRIFFRSNLIDHPRLARGAGHRADLVFFRDPRKGYLLRKNQL